LSEFQRFVMDSLSFVKILNPDSGIIEPGGQADLRIRLLGVSNPSDTLHAFIQISSNDPNNEIVLIDISLEVISTLQQNYPNPFNPVTTIRYQIPEPAEVKLIIYNILGQPVRHLLYGKLQPGFYQVIWDGRDDRGMPLSSGVYLYRFESRKFTRVKKMILLR